MLNQYRVRVPVRKVVEFFIKAESEEEAIKIGKENSLFKTYFSPGVKFEGYMEEADNNAPVLCDLIRSCPENTREQVLLEVIRDGGENYREALYCYETNKSLLDFDGWIHLQSIIGLLVSYEEYVHVSCKLEGDILDCTESDAAMLLRMLLRIRSK